ncbi:MAG: LamG domain-containing protein [Erysipelotrichaceae bacterium]|nr:LamG domain-containing protein [Erysipelotrichaceae bacterium]
MINKKVIINSSLILLTILSLTGCSSHQHDGIYQFDENKHWYGCNTIDCDEKFLEEDHNYGNWTVITESTCTTYGEEKRTCSLCGYQERRNIEKKTHTYPAGFEKDEVGHWSVCSVCDSIKTSSKVEHDYRTWEVVEEATITKEGLEKSTCVCGYVGTRVIPKINIPLNTIQIKEPAMLKNGSIELTENNSFDLETVINPIDATDVGNIVYSSSDETVAKINNGKVELLKEGFVEILASNGTKQDKLSFCVTNIKMDGKIDDNEYINHFPDVATSKGAGYETNNYSYVMFSEGGIYLSHTVNDKYISSYSHIEAALCFGDECDMTNTLFINMYPMENSFGNIKFFEKPTSFDGGKELTGNDAINCSISTIVKGTYGAYRGYDIETFIPYSELEKYGYTSDLEFVRYIPLVYQFKNQNDADKAALLSSTVGLKPNVAYGNINSLRAKYDTYLMPKFYRNGTHETPNRDPLVEYTFDDGKIVNTGTSSTANGRFTTIDQTKTTILDIVEPNVNFVPGADGKENSAIQLSNSMVGGNHFTIGGINIGKGDFTVSVKVNLQALTTDTDSRNYLFGIGNKKDAAEGYFNVAYKKNGTKNQIKLRVNGETKWVGYCPIGEFIELKLVRKGNTITFYLEKNEGTNDIRISSYQLNSDASIDWNKYDLCFSSNLGCQDPGDWPAYYDDIRVYDYAIPM